MPPETDASELPEVAAPTLAELGQVPWKQRTDARRLSRQATVWRWWTLLYTLPFLAAALALVAVSYTHLTLPTICSV